MLGELWAKLMKSCESKELSSIFQFCKTIRNQELETMVIERGDSMLLTLSNLLTHSNYSTSSLRIQISRVGITVRDKTA